MGKRYICLNCEYKWVSRKGFGEPSVCPHCKSKNIKDYQTKVRGDRIRHFEEMQEAIIFNAEKKAKLREELKIPMIAVEEYKSLNAWKKGGTLACITIWGSIVGVPILVTVNKKMKNLRLKYPRIAEVI